MAKKSKFRKFISNSWFKAFIIAFVILWLIKTFVFELAIVKDSNMENSLFKGDIIVINKWVPGPRMPITLISLPFFGNTFPFTNTQSYLNLIELPYLRLNFKAIKRNDIIAFNYPVENDPPIDKKTVLFKRCIGLPGDTLNIHDKKVFVNNNLISDNKNCKYRFRLQTYEPLDSTFYNKYLIFEALYITSSVYDIITTNQMADSISKDSLIKKIQILKVLDLPKFTQILFPYSPYFSWSYDYYGTINIPKKGDTINLTKKNIYFYKQIIENYENNQLNIENDSIFEINGVKTKTYTIKYNYYFVLDDNRDHAKDSRFWGFLPESHIIGKASYIFFNADSKSNRFLKRIE